jgi:hypothetical protein
MMARLSTSKKKEQKSMMEIIRRLRIRTFKKRFIYSKRNPYRKLVFEWDGAGISKEGKIVLIEAELKNIDEWHIQNHLAKVAVMVGRGTPIVKLVWIVYREHFRLLRHYVDSWLTFFLPVIKVQFPDIEYRTPKGDLIVD